MKYIEATDEVEGHWDLTPYEDARAVIVLTLAVTRPDGFLRGDIEQALIDQGLETPATARGIAGNAVSWYRHVLPNDVLICDDRTNIYRLTKSTAETRAWYIRHMRGTRSRLVNLATIYMPAGMNRHADDYNFTDAVEMISTSLMGTASTMDTAIRQMTAANERIKARERAEANAHD